MTTQTYLQVQNDVVTNVCLWDGDVNSWQPPADAVMLVQETTPCMVWEQVIVDEKVTDFVLKEVIGAGTIDDTWDGSVLTTDLSKPVIPTTLPA
jgi:hypothetical protein